MNEMYSDDFICLCGDEASTFFEFYSNLLSSMGPSWILEKGGGNAQIETRTEDNIRTVILNFSQLNMYGEETYPKIIIDFISGDDQSEENSESDESADYLVIFKDDSMYNYQSIYFPLNDDFVKYKPQESFKKWVEYLIKYTDKATIKREFQRYLRQSKRNLRQMASQVLLGRRSLI
jgi:hypothetical protein